MITRSKLVEQLREYQIRSQHKWGALTAFSPKPQITTRRDVVVALAYALLFSFFLVSSYATLHYRYYKLSGFIVCLGILLPAYLKFSRYKWLAKKREGRMLLPLSM